MSDYMFKLESHLSTDQFRVVGQVQAVAAAAGVSLFLTGGAMRDMLGGFPVRDLDFTVEGSALKLSKILTHKYGATIVSTDELRKSVEMRFPELQKIHEFATYIVLRVLVAGRFDFQGKSILKIGQMGWEFD